MTYTRDEIMQMSADELRVAIAKKRGYPYPYDKYRVPVSKPIMLDAPYDAQPIPDFRVELRDVPDYLNDIAAAWELVEEIRRGGDEITLNSDRRGNGSAIYSVVVLRLRNDNIGTGWTQIVNSEADTASLAISRAWLMWKNEAQNA